MQYYPTQYQPMQYVAYPTVVRPAIEIDRLIEMIIPIMAIAMIFFVMRPLFEK